MYHIAVNLLFLLYFSLQSTICIANPQLDHYFVTVSKRTTIQLYANYDGRILTLVYGGNPARVCGELPELPEFDDIVVFNKSMNLKVRCKLDGE